MARIATQPLNEQAVKRANDDFYRKRPEMIQDGKRIPIDPCNHKHARYQKEWMDSYEQHGGKTRKGKFTPQCGTPTEPCPCNGSLRIIIQGRRDGISSGGVPDAEVRLTGETEASGKTGKDGTVCFTNLEAGVHVIDVATLNDEHATDTVLVGCHKTTEQYVHVDLRELKRVVISWITKETWSEPPTPGRIRIRGARLERIVILERRDYVQKDWVVVSSKIDTLESKTAFLGSSKTDVQRVTVQYGPGSKDAVSVPVPGFYERSFGGWIKVLSSWTEYSGGDSLLEKHRP